MLDVDLASEMDIPFESFAKLVACLGNPPKYRSNSSSTLPPVTPSKIFASWLNHLSKPFVEGTGKHLFRLLFPHEGARRRYGLKETRLALELERAFGLNLGRWDAVTWDQEGGTGCLGQEVERLLRKRRSSQSPSGSRSKITIRKINILLDDLASHSPFSQPSQPRHTRTHSQTMIIQTLFRESNLSPYAVSVLIQIILRDLRPLLTPLPNLPIRNPSALLKCKPKDGPAELGIFEAMRRWDVKMLEFYRGGKGDLDYCADMAERMARRGPGSGTDGDDDLGTAYCQGPVVGINVPIPKCLKGRSIRDALNEFSDSGFKGRAETLWAETKYDGYRMQIHVDVNEDEPKITIFSKSKRNSTLDRSNTHAIILAALGLPIPANIPIHPALSSRLANSSGENSRMLDSSVILEAEVVPYNEGRREGGRGQGIEEFWWLDAAGVTHGDRSVFGQDKTAANGPNQIRDKDRHLCLVFFDILLLKDENLLGRSYDERRHLLEETVRPISGFSLTAERTCIPLSNRDTALQALERAFDISNQARQEGLVLKAAESTYTNMKWRWVKLKKDYIPNLGDCIDLVILGLGWDIDRARDLRVDTSVFTTFYVGVLTNLPQVQSRKQTPHFEFLFRVSYGMSRDQLEIYNQNIRYGRWKTKSFDRDDPFKQRLLGLSWTYTLPRGMTPPSVVLESPLCGEVMGAGFQKLPSSKYYELRWPRLQKIFEPSERSWADAFSSQDLIATAHKSLGYLQTTPISSPEDSVKALWRSTSHSALTDIPDSSESAHTLHKDRKKRKMYESAPTILKTSPSTPVSSKIVDAHSPKSGKDLVSHERLSGVVRSPHGHGSFWRPPATTMKRTGICTQKQGSDECREQAALDQPPDRSPLFSPRGVFETLSPVSRPLLAKDMNTDPLPGLRPVHTKLKPTYSNVRLGNAIELVASLNYYETTSREILAKRDFSSKRKKVKPLSLRSRIRLVQRKRILSEIL